jgi:hypothetical protein
MHSDVRLDVDAFVALPVDLDGHERALQTEADGRSEA